MTWLLWIVLLWTEGCLYLFEPCFSLDIGPGVELLYHMVPIFLVFKGITILFSILMVPIYIPTNMWAAVYGVVQSRTWLKQLSSSSSSSSSIFWASQVAHLVKTPGPGRSPGEGIGYSPQYSWASLVVQLVKNLLVMRETWVPSLGWEDPLEEGIATNSSILAWRIPMDRGAWQATVHGVPKNWAWLGD